MGKIYRKTFWHCCLKRVSSLSLATCKQMQRTAGEGVAEKTLGSDGQPAHAQLVLCKVILHDTSTDIFYFHSFKAILQISLIG